MCAYETMANAKYIYHIKNLYEKISQQPDFNEKYIYFPLHQDPEATTMARAILNSQLYAIKFLSDCLPNGWKIYVKEHPASFFSYEDTRYFLKNIQTYRTFKFYQTIETLPNTKLISIHSNHTQLINNAQAIYSITGTSLLQAVTMKKPIIILGKTLNFLELLRDSLCVSCKEDIQKAIQKIEKGWIPNYSDFDSKFNSYCFEMSLVLEHKDDYRELFILLREITNEIQQKEINK